MDGNPKGDYNMTERDEMDAAQRCLKDLKKHLRNIQNFNEDAGRLKEANAAFLCRSKLNVWHGEVTEMLHDLWPEHASDIQTRGPGGGR